MQYSLPFPKKGSMIDDKGVAERFGGLYSTVNIDEL